MKRAAMQHTKMRRLIRILDCPQYVAVGLLESLWHLTAREAPLGNIGKLDNEDIAGWIDWRGNADELVAALVTSGWIDVDKDLRLVVHDWKEHADEATKKAMSRQNPKVSVHVRTSPDRVGQKVPACALPEPEPEPVREKPLRSDERDQAPKPDALREIYEAYPRHKAPRAALRAIAAAVERVRHGEHQLEPCSRLVAAGTLLDITKLFAEKTRGLEEKFIPYPANWFNAAGYLENPGDWEVRSSARDGPDPMVGATGMHRPPVACEKCSQSEHPQWLEDGGPCECNPNYHLAGVGT